MRKSWDYNQTGILRRKTDKINEGRGAKRTGGERNGQREKWVRDFNDPHTLPDPWRLLHLTTYIEKR